MNDKLDKIDIIRERFDTTYEKASEALDYADGDVASALILLEKQKPLSESLIDMGVEIVNDVQKIIDKGSIKKLRIKLGNKIVREIPVTLTAAATIAIVFAAVLVTKLVIEVDRGEEDNVH